MSRFFIAGVSLLVAVTTLMGLASSAVWSDNQSAGGAVLAQGDNNARGETEFITITTAKYEIVWEARKGARMAESRALAEECSKVAQALYPIMKDHCKAEPKLAANERLKMRVYLDLQAMNKAVEEVIGEKIRGSAAYWPSQYVYKNKVNYWCLNDTHYFAKNERELRERLISSCLTQFLCQAKFNNSSFNLGWYGGALYGYFKRHQWDGKSLKVGWGLAMDSFDGALTHGLALMKDPKFDLGDAVNNNDFTHLAQCTALLLWMAHGSPENTQKFAIFRDLAEKGRSLSSTFKAQYGDPKVLKPTVIKWLEENQPPLIRRAGDWSNITENRVKLSVFNSGSRTALVYTPKEVTWFETVVIQPPEGPRVESGILLYFRSTDTYTMARFEPDGTVKVGKSENGRWTDLATAGKVEDVKDPTRRLMRAERREDKVVLTVDGTELGSYDLPAGQMGLYAYAVAEFESFKYPGYPPVAPEPVGRRAGRKK